MTHDLVPGDPHLIRMPWTEEVCMCFGPCCLGPGNTCLCKECDCQTMAARKARQRSEEKTTVVELRLPEYDHACGDCGREVFRNGTRGRYPSRCPECKEKQ